jgi:hypothetical protein
VIGPDGTTEPGGAIDMTARRRHRDGDLWCLLCHGWIMWRATAERYEHETTSNPRCHPLDPTDPARATPAPDDMAYPTAETR